MDRKSVDRKSKKSLWLGGSGIFLALFAGLATAHQSSQEGKRGHSSPITFADQVVTKPLTPQTMPTGIAPTPAVELPHSSNMTVPDMQVPQAEVSALTERAEAAVAKVATASEPQELPPDLQAKVDTLPLPLQYLIKLATYMPDRNP